MGYVSFREGIKVFFPTYPSEDAPGLQPKNERIPKSFEGVNGDVLGICSTWSFDPVFS